MRAWLPWLFFGCSFFTMPVVFLVGYLLGSQSSPAQPFYETPIEVVGLCFCGLSPFFTRLPFWLRLLISVFGLLLFAAVYCLCIVMAMAIFGTGLPC